MAEHDASLSEAITRDSLLRRAGRRSFGLGEAYLAGGAVVDLAEEGGEITAQVQGTELYDVTLAVDEEGELDYVCSCPFSAETGAFCKHCVAVGLAWLEPPPGATTPHEREPGPDDIRAYLETQSREEILGLLMEQVLADRDLRNRLLMAVARAAEGGPDIKAMRRAIDRAADTGGLVDYRGAHAYADRVSAAAGAIGGLIDDGYADQAVELVRYAIDALEDHIEQVDDSSGWVGGVLEDLQSLHYRACAAAKPDPEDLAHWLLHKRLQSEWSSADRLDEYRGLLGERGLAAYRREAKAEWERLPVLAPGQEDPQRYGRTARLEGIMADIADESGDVEDLVAIIKRDLSRPWDYLEIATIYEGSGDADKALEWAQRGLSAYPRNPDVRLVDFVVEQLRVRERHDEALGLLWERYQDRPFLETYQALHAYAAPVGRWPEWRERALSLLRAETARPPERAGPRAYGADNSELVRLLLWEGDTEAAWREAQSGRCSTHLLLELAGAREEDHPEDAVRVYQQAVEPMVAPVTNGVYEEPVRLIGRVGKLMRRLGRSDEFREWVEGLRTTYKRKRNFVSLLDSMRIR